MKYRYALNSWLWKWHFIAGLISLPFVFLLAVTGGIYLFKDIYEDSAFAELKTVTPGVARVDYQTQWILAEEALGRPVEKMLVPEADNQTTEFVLGKHRDKVSVYVDPYKAEVTGAVAIKDTLMFDIRKLHGELLLGAYGTKVVELVASWCFVLIITGIYVWWPKGGFTLVSLYRIRRGEGKRIFYRDLHAVLGFWLSLFLLIILAGGMPWTDVFGGQFKRLQQLTDSGYPATYKSSRGLQSEISGQPLSLDDMVVIATQQRLPGVVTITLPSARSSVFSVANEALKLSDERVIHFDQYSGRQLLAHNWADVGGMAQGREVVMRLHQGQFFGLPDWLLVLLVAVMLSVTSIAALLTYLLRKPAGRWGVPRVPAEFKAGTSLLVMIVALGLFFPLFGASLVVISLAMLWTKRRQAKRQLSGGVGVS